MCVCCVRGGLCWCIGWRGCVVITANLLCAAEWSCALEVGVLLLQRLHCERNPVQWPSNQTYEGGGWLAAYPHVSATAASSHAEALTKAVFVDGTPQALGDIMKCVMERAEAFVMHCYTDTPLR